jgi:hypothetical protein
MDGAKIPEVTDQIIELIGCKQEDILLASGRSGIGIEEILQAIAERIPAPVGDTEAPLQALIFDSVFNSFRGIIVYYRIMNGVLKKNDKIRFVASGRDYNADEVGVIKLVDFCDDAGENVDIDNLFLQCSCLRNLRLIIGFKRVDLSNFCAVLSVNLDPPRASRCGCPSLVGSFSCDVVHEVLCSTTGEANLTPPVTFLSFFAFFCFGSCCCGCCCSC